MTSKLRFGLCGTVFACFAVSAGGAGAQTAADPYAPPAANAVPQGPALPKPAPPGFDASGIGLGGPPPPPGAAAPGGFVMFPEPTIVPVPRADMSPEALQVEPGGPTLPPDELVARSNEAVFSGDPLALSGQSPLVVKLQIMLDRANASPGVIDGYGGDNVRKAIAGFEEMSGLPVDGVLDPEVWSLLEAARPGPVLTGYTITPEDVAGPFEPDLPRDYAELAQLETLAYRDSAERLAEMFHMDREFLIQINSGVDFDRAGEAILVADTGGPAQADIVHLVADKAQKQLRGYDASGALVVSYPATIGSRDLPSPEGTHVVEAIAVDAEYWYRPDVNFQQGENTEALRLAPGPNNPIGSVWIDLSEPTYGIHGTPEPDAIDKGFSHGCIRLTNWDVEELADMVAIGIPVDFVGGAPATVSGAQ